MLLIEFFEFAAVEECWEVQLHCLLHLHVLLSFSVSLPMVMLELFWTHHDDQHLKRLMNPRN